MFNMNRSTWKMAGAMAATTGAIALGWTTLSDDGVLAQAQAPVRFASHVVAEQVPGGYQILAVDLNKDNRPDLLALGLSAQGELAWYENPTWQRHVLAGGFERLINLDAEDLDGDGIPEIAVAHGFTTNTETSVGGLSLLSHKGSPTEPWERRDIDAIPTSHRIRWVNADGRGQYVLVNAPLIGPGSTAPEYRKPVSIAYYEAPDWKRQIVTNDEEGVIHGILAVSVAPFGDGRAESLLSASFKGIFQHHLTNGTWQRTQLTPGNPKPWPESGTSDVAIGHHGSSVFMAAIEHWHGNEVAIYRQNGATWTRQTIDDQITDGHALATADFAGQGRSAVVAGERQGKRSVYVYWPPASLGGAWQKQVLDDAMGAASCVTADLNGDKRPDIACIAGRAPSVKWYENLGR